MPGCGTLAALCLIQFLSWGVLFYTLPISAARLQSEGWTLEIVSGIYTLSLIVSALAGPPIGRLTDLHGPKKTIFVGALVGALAMLASCWADNIAIFAGTWMLVGLAQAATLYQPALAAVAQWYGNANPWPPLAITCAGGLSSAFFAPLTAALIDSHGWRVAFILLASTYGVLAVSTAWLFIDSAWKKPAYNPDEHRALLRSISTSSEFRYSQASLTVSALCLYAITLNLIPLLEELDFTYQQAALVFGAVGAAQLVGRWAFVPVAHRSNPRQRLALEGFLCFGTLLALAVIITPAALIVTLAMLAGAIRGAHTLVVASVVSDRWGKESYASVYGRFNLPIGIAMALSPVLGQLTASWLNSHRSACLLFAVFALLAVGLSRRA